jgi:hypothetical protein
MLVGGSVAFGGTLLYRFGSFSSSARFEEPVFRFGEKSLLLQRALFRNLRTLMPKLEDVRETKDSPGGAAHWSLTLSLPPGINFRATTQGIETTFLNLQNLRAEVLPAVKSVLEQVEESVVAVLPEKVQFSDREFIFNAHFALGPGEYATFTAPFRRDPPKELGLEYAHGMSFYFRSDSGPESDLIIDRSVLVPEGLFFQVKSRFSGAVPDLRSSFQTFHAFLAQAIASTKLGGAF